MKRIILFGGSFDPIHNGHILMAENAKKILNADEVVFILAKNARWKNTSTSFLDRLNMLQIAISKYEGFKISDIEYFSKSNYTYDTVKELIEAGNEYYLLIGNDQIDRLHEWYEIEKLSKLVNIVMYRRNEEKFNIDNVEKYNVRVLDGPIYEQSSSDFRNLKSCKINSDVLVYIKEHELYFIKKVKKYISEKRFEHSFSVGLLAKEIAEIHHLDESVAFIAGLLHDIAKDIDKVDARALMNKYYKTYSSLDEYAYHQFLSEIIIRSDFNIDDKNILKAVKTHCTGDLNMNAYQKLIYACDKIDPLRGYDSKYMIDALKKDLDEGFKLVLSENIKFLNSKKTSYNNIMTDACVKQYLRKE